MKIAFLCFNCSKENLADLNAKEIKCVVCENLIFPEISESINRFSIIDKCCICGNEKFYVQKDFNRKLGLAIVLLSVIFSYLFLGFTLLSLIVGLSICALVDFLLYKTLPEATVCYACNSVYRGYIKNPVHKPFDLNVAEEYEKP